MNERRFLICKIEDEVDEHLGTRIAGSRSPRVTDQYSSRSICIFMSERSCRKVSVRMQRAHFVDSYGISSSQLNCTPANRGILIYHLPLDLYCNFTSRSGLLKYTKQYWIKSLQTNFLSRSLYNQDGCRTA